MSTKRFRTYYLLNQLLQINFLEKKFEGTSENQFVGKFEINILKIDFDHKQCQNDFKTIKYLIY